MMSRKGAEREILHQRPRRVAARSAKLQLSLRSAVLKSSGRLSQDVVFPSSFSASCKRDNLNRGFQHSYSKSQITTCPRIPPAAAVSPSAATATALARCSPHLHTVSTSPVVRSQIGR